MKRILNMHEEATHSRLRQVCRDNSAQVFAKCLISEITPGLAGSFFQPDNAVAGHARHARCAARR
jgi:hypothetical protein